MASREYTYGELNTMGKINSMTNLNLQPQKNSTVTSKPTTNNSSTSSSTPKKETKTTTNTKKSNTTSTKKKSTTKKKTSTTKQSTPKQDTTKTNSTPELKEGTYDDIIVDVPVTKISDVYPDVDTSGGFDSSFNYGLNVNNPTLTDNFDYQFGNAFDKLDQSLKRVETQAAVDNAIQEAVVNNPDTFINNASEFIKDMYQRSGLAFDKLNTYTPEPYFKFNTDISELAKEGSTTPGGYYDYDQTVLPSDLGTRLKAIRDAGISTDLPAAIQQANAKQAEDMLNKAKSGFFGLSNEQMETAPIFGALGNVIADITGLQNKNDYTEAERLENAANALKANTITYNPNYNYATYNPTNLNSAIDAMLAQNSMNVANLNNSGLGAAERMASAIQNNKNLFTSMGSVVNQINQANNAEKNNIRNINNTLDAQNAQQSMAAQQHNANARANVDAQRLAGLQQALGLRIAERNANDAAKSANINALFDNIFNLGRDRINRNNANAIGSSYGYENKNEGGFNYLGNNRTKTTK